VISVRKAHKRLNSSQEGQLVFDLPATVVQVGQFLAFSANMTLLAAVDPEPGLAWWPEVLAKIKKMSSSGKASANKREISVERERPLRSIR
jgi:hypothetical protein